MDEHNPLTCEGCIYHEKCCKEILTGLSGQQFEIEWNKSVKRWKQLCPMFLKHTHIGNGKHNGLFAGTLTMSNKDQTNELEMVSAMRKIFSQKTCPVKKYAWYVEYTENGLPHIHFIYETDTGGRIHQKVFKRYWKIWDESVRCGKGHRGGYHNNVLSPTAYKEYIEKDGGLHHEFGFTEQMD